MQACRRLKPSSSRHSSSRARQQRSALAHAAQPQRKCRVYDLHDRVIPYEQAWGWQHRQLELALAQKARGDAEGSDALLLMQHEPVYTLGTGSSEGHLLFDPADSPIPLYRTERGGEVTYHGPGQLVMYPLLHLGAPGSTAPRDLHLYMRSLEEVVIRALAEVSGLQGGRIEGLTGVWVGQHKLAAIGVRAKQWVTYHGVALNVCPDLGPFASIVPCGISDRAVGSVVQQLQGSDLSLIHTDKEMLLLEYRYALLAAFEEVFGLELEQTDVLELVGASSSSEEAESRRTLS